MSTKTNLSNTKTNTPRWFESIYLRLLVDNHITEDDPSFMTRFDPEEYVAMVKAAGVDAAMVSACCHNGNCYYPTRIGHMHAGLGGRDIFGETVGLLRSRGITPLAYYTTIYHNHSAQGHPDWQTVDPAGKHRQGRYWHACPNHPEYRRFALQQIGEVIAYDVDGIFIDMTFWPGICVCPSCQERYQAEAGSKIPDAIDWRDEKWVHFQRARERWIGEFAQQITDFIKSRKPQMSVTHQFSPVLLGWYLSQSPANARATDYTSGDFYGGKHQQRLATKVLAAFSAETPFEYMTSRCVNLNDHASTKSEAELICAGATTLANGGACCLIDAINPDGTLLPGVYARLGRVTRALEPFTNALRTHRPSLVGDTGLYISMASHVEEDLSGRALKDVTESLSNMTFTSRCGAVNELLGVSVILNRAKMPYRVVTSETADFSGLNAIYVGNAAYMDAQEVARLREFVRGGGTLIATGLTSYYNLEGKTSGDFALADVFGVSTSGEMSKRVHFVARDGQPRHVLCDRPAPLVEPAGAKVLAHLAEPTFEPDDAERWASIHSNPPGRLTGFAAMTINEFGRGKCIYLASSLLAMQQDAQQSFGVELFGNYAPSNIILKTNAPVCMEITLLKSSTQSAYLLCFVNYQDELPNVPVRDIVVTLRLPGGWVPTACRTVSDRRDAEFEKAGEQLTFRLKRIETGEMIEILL